MKPEVYQSLGEWAVLLFGAGAVLGTAFLAHCKGLTGCCDRIGVWFLARASKRRSGDHARGVASQELSAIQSAIRDQHAGIMKAFEPPPKPKLTFGSPELYNEMESRR